MVSVYLLAATLVLALVNSLLLNGLSNTMRYAGVNLSLLLVQLTGVIIYFSLKNKAFTNIFNKYLGIGDLLFFGTVIFCFSPVNFLLFSLIAYLIILLFFGILILFLKDNSTIPLAGCLSVFLMVTNILNKTVHVLEPYNDDRLLALFIKLN
jgi:hypothetical protein